MKESSEPVKNLESNTNETPNEYIVRANELIKKREQDEAALREAFPENSGRDDRLCGMLYRLDIKLREDLSLLRKEYGIEPAQK